LPLSGFELLLYSSRMQPTAYPPVNELLESLLAQMQEILSEKLVGLYLYGSLVTGDFDPDISDVDLLAATSHDIDEREFSALKQMQDDIVLDHPEWTDCLEIAYVSRHALKTFKTHTSTIAVINPDEQSPIKDAGRDYLINWYTVREKGRTLFGPPPDTIIEPISQEEFIQAVKEYARAWRERIDDAHSRPWQAYAILTLCRALYSCAQGEQVSKLQAAVWAAKEWPEWSSTIQNALVWRRAWREEDVSSDATLPETRRFVNFVIDQVLS
jgi:hypothetical protein